MNLWHLWVFENSFCCEILIVAAISSLPSLPESKRKLIQKILVHWKSEQTCDSCFQASLTLFQKACCCFITPQGRVIMKLRKCTFLLTTQKIFTKSVDLCQSVPTANVIFHFYILSGVVSKFSAGFK